MHHESRDRMTAPAKTCMRSHGVTPRLKQVSVNWKMNRGDGRVVGGTLITVCCWGISSRVRISD